MRSVDRDSGICKKNRQKNFQAHFFTTFIFYDVSTRSYIFTKVDDAGNWPLDMVNAIGFSSAI